MKIFLVDDEQPVLDGLSLTIKKRFNNLTVCGTARNGKDALLQIPLCKPDLVLMDVRMPGISGLETVRELKKVAPNVLPILLTAYERFDIAKEAFELGVFDYLLKPVSQDTLVACLENAINKIEERSLIEDKSVKTENKLLLHEKLLEDAFFLCMSSKEKANQLAEEYLRALNYTEEKGLFIGFKYSCNQANDGEENNEVQSVTEISEYLKSVLSYKTDCLVSVYETDTIIAFVPLAKSETEKSLYDFVKKNSSLDRKWLTNILVGKEKTMNTLYEDFNELLLAVNSSQEKKVVLLSEAVPISTDSSNTPLLEKLINAAEEKNELAFFESLSSAYKRIKDFSKCDYDVQSFLTACQISCYLILETIDTREPFKALFFSQNISYEYLHSYFKQLFLERGNRGTTSKIVNAAIKYLEENYMKQISLEETADYLKISPAHLSRLFAQNKQVSFIDWLTEMRISKAKRLLLSGTKNIKEISNAVGYSDPNYFSRLFKKITGKTPSEYSGDEKGLN